MGEWVFVNDAFVSEQKASLHFTDLSFQRGYGVFDFFRLRDNKPLFFNDHLERFYSSAQNMHLPVPAGRTEIEEIISDLVERNNLPNTGVRLSLTGGYSLDGFNPGKPNLLISQHSFLTPSKAQHETGIALFTYPHQRQLPHIKTIDYLMPIWLQPLRMQKSADDVLYYNNGFITECPRSNFFLVTHEGHIVTPVENVLKGITRKKAIALAREEFIVEERLVHFDEIKTAREAFVTSTTKQILAVASIDEKIFAERNVSTALLQRFRSAYGV